MTFLNWDSFMMFNLQFVCTNGLCKQNKVDEVWMQSDCGYYAILVLVGTYFSPDVYTYNVYINGLSKQNKVDEALKNVSFIDKLGCNPNVISNNILLGIFVWLEILVRQVD